MFLELVEVKLDRIAHCSVGGLGWKKVSDYQNTLPFEFHGLLCRCVRANCEIVLKGTFDLLPCRYLLAPTFTFGIGSPISPRAA